MKKRLLLCLLVCCIFWGFAGCGESELEKAQDDLQKTHEKYGWVEEETVDVLVGKFNAQIVDNSSLNPASDDFLTVGENQYWYGLIEGIYLVVEPEEFKNDKTTEIVDYMILSVDKSSQYADDALEYVKYLIKANNNEITDEEIYTLIANSKELSSSKTSANNGKGISVGYIEDDENYEYQVIRLYK